MRTRTPLALAAALIGFGFTSAISRTPSPPTLPSPEAETARIRAHFDSVLAELPGRDVAALTSSQRARRSSLLGTLRAYRDAGVFPRNYDFPGEAVPYFVDRETGTLCAVAHLVASTGRRDIVDRVARTDNNVLVAQLAGDSAFGSWLDAHGLTLAEAARIQVPYDMVEDRAPASTQRAATAASSLALGSAAIASIWTARSNADGSSRLGNTLGVIAGIAAFGTGAATIGTNDRADVLGMTTMLAGATSAWLSTRGALRNHRAVAAKRESERATVAPVLPVDGKSAGISLTLRF